MKTVRDIIFPVTWAELKAISVASSSPIRMRPLDSARECYVFTDLSYRSYLTDPGEVSEADGLYDNTTPSPQKVSQELTESGSAIWQTTHDFCAPESWWPKSVKVDNEQLIEGGTGSEWFTQDYGDTDVPIYGDGNTPKYIVNLSAKLMLNEKDIIGHSDSKDPWDLSYWHPSGHNLVPVLKDYQGNTLTRAYTGNPGTGEWDIADQGVDPGKVITGDDWSGNPPTLSYNYPTFSDYIILPKAGKYFKVGMAEVNSRNSDWDDKSFWFEVTVANEAVVAARRIYQSEADVIAASVGAPSTWRDWDILQWPYDQAGSPIEDVRVPVKSSVGMGVRLYIPEHLPYSKYDTNGRRPSLLVTLYAVSFDE